MLPILGSTFWQSMKNKVRKSKKPSESGHSVHVNGKRTWDLRVLLEQEPRMWSACFRTPESFVKIADCLVSMYGIQPIDIHAIDESESILGDRFVPLPNLKPAGSVTLQNERLYISSMDLCRYYWRNKGNASFDRQMQSWNAGRRAALREKTKSYVHVDETNAIDTEWWDIEGILCSTKVLRKFLVSGEGARALTELARYVYQRRKFYEDSPSSPSSPKDSAFFFPSEAEDVSSAREVPAVRRRIPSKKGADCVNSLTILTPRKRPRTTRSPSFASSSMPATPLSPHAVPISPITRIGEQPWSPHASNFGAPQFSPFSLGIQPTPGTLYWRQRSGFDVGRSYDFDPRPRFGMRQPSFDGSTSGSSTTTAESGGSSSSTSSPSMGLMLLVDAAAAREEYDDQKDPMARSESRSSRSFSTDSHNSEGSTEDEREGEGSKEEKPTLVRRPSLTAGDKLRGYESSSIFRSVAVQPI